MPRAGRRQTCLGEKPVGRRVSPAGRAAVRQNGAKASTRPVPAGLGEGKRRTREASDHALPVPPEVSAPTVRTARTELHAKHDRHVQGDLVRIGAEAALIARPAAARPTVTRAAISRRT
jgi:hypothetical protein